MKKFNELFESILKLSVDIKQAKLIFLKLGLLLVEKLNNILKSRGFLCYFTLVGDVYFYSGYRQKLKFHPVGDNKGQSWFLITNQLVGTETKNLVFQKESANLICLKSTYRKLSHRGEVVNF